MKKVVIWLEGIADQKFVADAISDWYEVEFDKDFRSQNENFNIAIKKANGVSSFTTADGWQKILGLWKDSESKGYKNVIILDMDQRFEDRKQEVSNTVVSDGFDSTFDLYLWPQNRPEPPEKGDLEALLERIIHPKNQLIFDCWNNYENCIRTGEYTLPAKKTKIYAYLEALLGNTNSEKEKIKERERNYRNPNHWTLHPDHPSLRPLKDFFDRHFSDDSNDITVEV
jgi:hypothetical protein